jgi:hypothetical protein
MRGWILGLVARLWLATLRLEILPSPALLAVMARPWVLSFFHGTQFALLGWKRRRQTAVLVSHSKDGQLQAGALRSLGLVIARGSSSRGGATGLRNLISLARDEGLDIAFAVDGPRGPLGVAKPGALAAARAVGGVLVPMGVYAAHKITLTKAWDRFQLPLPFSRVRVVLGAPLADGLRDASHLSSAIAQANEDAAGASIASVAALTDAA